jgi:hypothetical protein
VRVSRKCRTDERCSRGRAAERAERPLDVALAERDERVPLAAEEELRRHAEAAAPLAGPRGVGPQLVLEDAVRRLLLEHLVVLVEHAAGGVDHADVIVPVAPLDRARAALM